MVRSLGGWDEVRKMRLGGQERIKSDQRILGESDFAKVVERVSVLFQLDKDYITARWRQRDRVRARDLLCYWAVVELGMPMVDLARKFAITPAAVSYAVQRREKMAKERGCQLET